MQNLVRPQGSTVILFDAYGVNALAQRPHELKQAVRTRIKGLQLTPRERDLLDNHYGDDESASTIFVPLEESHVRLHANFFRVETWPEEGNYINGEVQICNYTRDNQYLTYVLFWNIMALLEPKRVEVMSVSRGPFRSMEILRTPAVFEGEALRRMFTESSRQLTPA